MISVISPWFLVFAAAFVPAWFAAPAARRWQVLLAGNLLFYCLAMSHWSGAVALIASSLVVWAASRRAGPKGGRGWLALGLAAALGPLLLLKYSRMLWPGLPELILPLGLSYYSLQLISYLLDVRAGRQDSAPDAARLLCYASSFLSITQGPFQRYGDLMPQLERPVSFEASRLYSGAQRMAWGYFKKLAVADRAAVVVSAVFAAPETFDRSQLAFGVVLFAVQLYADFSGYTDIVLGLGEVLGLRLPENFRQPYLALSVGDFWDRWHISLSTWLREYVFEPLTWSGWNTRLPVIGQRWAGQPVLTSLMLTFLVSGLWHGAAWNFVVWGALNGFYQVVSAWTRRGRKKLWKRLNVGAKNPVRRWWQRLFVFFWICVGYVFFCAGDIGVALRYLWGIVAQPGHAVFSEYWRIGLISRLDLLLLLAGVALVVAVDLVHERGVRLRAWLAQKPRALRWAVYQCAIFAFLLMGRFLAGGGFLSARF